MPIKRPLDEETEFLPGLKYSARTITALFNMWKKTAGIKELVFRVIAAKNIPIANNSTKPTRLKWTTVKQSEVKITIKTFEYFLYFRFCKR